MTTVKPIKAVSQPGVPRIEPKALTYARLCAAMDVRRKPSPSTQNVVDLLTGKAVPHG